MQRVATVERFDDEPRVQNLTPPAWDSRHLAPSHSLTYHQMFYLFVLDGIGGMIISGGVNFGLAYAMYTTQDTVKTPIRLFQLPNTLAGDAAVTIIIQCILTWFVEKALVASDLSRRGVQPIGFVSKPTRPWLRWLVFLPPLGYDKTGGEEFKGEFQPKAAGPGFATVLASVLQEALRGFLFAVVGFILLWPLGVGILTAVGKRSGGDYTYTDRWIPEIFKLILGGVLGLLTTPFMAMFWLVKAGWEGELHRGLDP
ncbi:hypothetical protein B0T10DRAFT_415396 [Thelonectria olida]|uniref:Uncharacterized protein n=1 Tax=Thelonectria olida TaxID=1576542 RepID=A0A9P8VRZ0_9HYPO|nr:hypothetical protein B0T10DRAFT_415396 [Thelonectria olida]